MSAAYPIPAEDADLDAVFQALVVQLTGLDGTLVRPRWQPNPPKQPEPGTTWCAVGVLMVTPNDGASITHDPTYNSGAGADVVSRHESIEVLASFYGPQSQAYTRYLREGIALPQNTEGLAAIAIRWTECGPIRAVPELVNQQWIRRQDMSLRFNRQTLSVYAVPNMAISAVHLFDDSGQQWTADNTVMTADGGVIGQPGVVWTADGSPQTQEPPSVNAPYNPTVNATFPVPPGSTLEP